MDAIESVVVDWPGIPVNVGTCSTTRRGGTSAAPYDDGSGGGGLNLGMHVGDATESVYRNRALLRALLPAEPAWLAQVHGADVLDVREIALASRADACVATQPGLICAILTADCLPVLLCDVAGRVVGAAHAGWRGLSLGVLENTVARMHDAGAEEIFAWLGPAIGPERFEVGEDVVRVFVDYDEATMAAFRPLAGRPGKYLADIYALARKRLNRAGVARVDGGGLCTMTDAARFYSYRRDGTTGRMASMIWLK